MSFKQISKPFFNYETASFFYKKILGVPRGPGYTLLLRHKAHTQTFTGVAASIPHAFTTGSFMKSFVSKNYLLLQSNVAK